MRYTDMEVNITKFFNGANPSHYSASKAEIGDDAGPTTWRNAMASTYNYITDVNVEEWRAYIRGSGGWTPDEVAAFTMQELNALFIQWISGDIREAGLDTGTTWEEYEKDAAKGLVSENLFKLGEEIFWMGE